MKQNLDGETELANFNHPKFPFFSFINSFSVPLIFCQLLRVEHDLFQTPGVELVNKNPEKDDLTGKHKK